jgi:hypothetical protein
MGAGGTCSPWCRLLLLLLLLLLLSRLHSQSLTQTSRLHSLLLVQSLTHHSNDVWLLVSYLWQ